MTKAELKALLDKNKDGKVNFDDVLLDIDNDAKASFWLGLATGALGGGVIVSVVSIIF